MLKESERTRVMKENFMALHLEGDTIAEIAERYNLSKVTVYQAFARDCGCTWSDSRESPSKNCCSYSYHRTAVC